MEDFTAIQYIVGFAGIVIVAFSIVGWFGIIFGSTQRSEAEQAQLDKEQAAYFKRYRVKPPITWRAGK